MINQPSNPNYVIWTEDETGSICSIRLFNFDKDRSIIPNVFNVLIARNERTFHGFMEELKMTLNINL